MKGVVGVVTRDNFVTWEMKALYRAARKAGFRLVRIDPLRWAFDVQALALPGLAKASSRREQPIRAVLGRVDQDALLEGVRALEAIAAAGVPVLNGPSAVRSGRDKALTALSLRLRGVPFPETHIVGRSAPERLRHLPYPVVVKPLVGGGGAGLARANGPKELARILAGSHAPLLVQRLVADVERELRAVVLDGEVIACVAKSAAPGEWRANLTLGGGARPVRPPRESARTALEAVRAVGADFAAVDVLETSRGPLVIDVNVCPGFRRVEEATGADIAGGVVAALRRRMDVHANLASDVQPVVQVQGGDRTV